MNKDVIDFDIIMGPIVAENLNNGCINNLMVAKNHEREHLRTTNMHNNTNIYGEESISSYNFKFVEETQSNTLQATVVEFQSRKEDTIAKIQNKNEVFLRTLGLIWKM